MVNVQQQEDTVVFTVEGWHKLWAFRSELRIPRVHITSARSDPAAAVQVRGIRAGGTSVPGLIQAGTFYLDGFFDNKPTFIDVRHPNNTVVIELTDEHYTRLIIEVENPATVVALLSSPPPAG